MRHIRLTTAAVLLAACGGSGEVAAPPAAGVPASIVIHAGDNQSGEPGRPLPARPAVLVKDVSGSPVANVAVSFAVDSGGGGIAAGQVHTGTNGVATGGDWTLGPGEGRNTLTASVAGLSAVTLQAFASHAGVSIPLGTVSTTGGTLVLTRPGSVIDGLTIDVPDSAFSAPVSFSVTTRSSTGLTLADAIATRMRTGLSLSFRQATAAIDAGLVPVTPVLILTSNGPPTASGEVVLRIPLPAPVSYEVVIAVVDSLGNPVAFLQPVGMDATSVTVTTRGLDQTVFAQVAPSSGPRTLSIVVFRLPGQPNQLEPLSQLLPRVRPTDFHAGSDDFEFPDPPTAYALDIHAGMVLATWGAYGKFFSGINRVFQRAPGVWQSNVHGLMLSAGLSVDYARTEGRYGPSWIDTYWAAWSPVRSTRAALISVYYFLGYVETVPLVLSNGVKSRLVLAVGWNPQSETLEIHDPAFPGQLRTLQFVNSVMQPYPDPHDPAVRYFIPYFSNVPSSMWQAVKAGVNGLPDGQPAPYASVWPAGSYQTWGAIVPGTTTNDPDSVFMTTNDTSRVWLVAHQPGFPVATTLPVTPDWGLQPGDFFAQDVTTGAWSFDSHTTDRFIDASPNHFYERTFGMALQRLEPAPSGGGTVPAWLGWRVTRAVKYDLVVPGATGQPGVPIPFTVSTSGGPALPQTATYEWDFGDGQPPTRITGPAPVQHTYANPGTFTLILRVLHPGTGKLIGRQSAGVEVGMVNVTVDFSKCPLPATPQWFAIQDGSAAWTERLDTGGGILPTGVYRFGVTQGKGGYAYATADGRLVVEYRTQAELTAAPIVVCAGSKAVTGTVVGLAPGKTAQVSLGGSTTIAVPNGPFTITGVADGPQDLVAYTHEPFWLNDRVIIVRGLDPQHGSSVGTVDFSASSAVEGVIWNLGSPGPLDSQYLNYLSMEYFTGSCRRAILGPFDASSRASFNTMRIPAALQASSDMISPVMQFTDPATGTRTVRHYHHTIGNGGGFGFGVALQVPAVSALPQSAYLRLQAAFALPADYQTGVTFSYTGTSSGITVTVDATTGWLAGQGTIGLPGFSGVAGWSDNLAPALGEAGTWTLTARGETGAPCTEAARVITAARSGVF